MSLTTAQKATLKTYILSQPDLVGMTSGTSTDYAGISSALNLDANPVTLAWRTNVHASESDEAATYSAFDSILAGKRDSWGFFLGFSRNFSRNKVRSWITDVWGNATAGSIAESILQAGTEKASRAEVALGGSTKTTGTVSALDRAFEGDITINDIAELFNV